MSKFNKLGVFHRIQESTKIGTRIFKIDQEMTKKIELKVGNPPQNIAENGPISANSENLPFLKVRFINFFLIPVAQTYQNESAPIFYYVKTIKC